MLPRLRQLLTFRQPTTSTFARQATRPINYTLYFYPVVFDYTSNAVVLVIHVFHAEL